MEIGWHDRADVVLEIDHTTDVRRGKLWRYEDWGFPEVRVDVPETKYAVRRPTPPFESRPPAPGSSGDRAGDGRSGHAFGHTCRRPGGGQRAA